VEEEKPLEEEVKDDRQKEIDERKKNQQQNTQISVAEKAQKRREEAQKRREEREAQRQQLASSAQLALITGGANASGEAVTDVLGDATSNLNLDDALKNTSGISIAQNSGSKTRIVQGSRQSGSGNVDDLVSDIGGMSSTSLSSRKLDIDFGEVDLGSAAATKSGRSNEELNTKLREIKPAVENCFKQEKRLNPNLKGSLKVVFSVNARGQVRSVNISENSLKNSKVEDCIKQKFRTLRFPAAKDEITATTRYLFE
jgi:outer membrane biosynthesis protein TonB